MKGPDMKSYEYRNYQIDLHPYAGGYKAFIFPPTGSGHGLEPVPVVVGPDGAEEVNLEAVLRDARQLIDSLYRQPASA